jgi:hypothetical protein
MSANYFETKDIVVAKAKCQDEPWFKLDISKTKTNNKKNQKTYYIPFTARNVSGKHIPLTLKFSKQVLSSNAKIPADTDESEARHVSTSYREITMDDLESTDYEESKRAGLIQSNTEFIEALNTICDEYAELVEREVIPYKGDKFRATSKMTVYNIRQTQRKAGDGEESENGMIDLPHAIFRIKLTADPESKKIGYNSEKTGHIYTVFDMKKTTDAVKNAGGKKTKPVVAKIKTSNGYTDLTISNVKHFVTYMSLTGGVVTFDSVCISKAGISLMCRFKELHVWRHRPMTTNAMDEVTMNDMAAFGAVNADGDDEEVFDEPNGDNEDGSDSDSKAKKSKSKSKSKPPVKNMSKALDNDGDDEATLSDVDSNGSEDEPVKSKPTSKPVSKVVAKPVSKPTPKKTAPTPAPEPESESDSEPAESVKADAADEAETEEPTSAAEDEPEDEPEPVKAKPVTKATTAKPAIKTAPLTAGKRGK